MMEYGLWILRQQPQIKAHGTARGSTRGYSLGRLGVGCEEGSYLISLGDLGPGDPIGRPRPSQG